MRVGSTLLLLFLVVGAAVPGTLGSFDGMVGASCGTVTPGQNEACCERKAADGSQDSWCQDNYPDLLAPAVIVGSSCGTVSPDSREDCCRTKVDEDSEDEWCADTFPELYSLINNGTLDDYPYLAYIEGPNGACTGSLVAPGYILTTASCVTKASSAASADSITALLGGKLHEVEALLVNQDSAQFNDFSSSKSSPSWDVAMLALREASDAAYVALPTSDVPAAGDTVKQTAWSSDAAELIDTADIRVAGACADGWTDDFCASGSDLLRDACPTDKGAPLLKGHTQVGLTSGPGCPTSDSGVFLKLADKGVLEQITVWLNSREGTTNSGLDDNVRAWMQEAYKYLYE